MVHNDESFPNDQFSTQLNSDFNVEYRNQDQIRNPPELNVLNQQTQDINNLVSNQRQQEYQDLQNYYNFINDDFNEIFQQLPVHKFQQFIDQIKNGFIQKKYLIEDDSNYALIFNIYKSCMNSILQNSVTYEEQVKNFINETLYNSVQIILDRNFINLQQEVKTQVLCNYFLKLVIDFCLKMIETQYIGIFLILKKITFSGENYYDTFRYNHDQILVNNYINTQKRQIKEWESYKFNQIQKKIKNNQQQNLQQDLFLQDQQNQNDQQIFQNIQIVQSLDQENQQENNQLIGIQLNEDQFQTSQINENLNQTNNFNNINQNISDDVKEDSFTFQYPPINSIIKSNNFNNQYNSIFLFININYIYEVDGFEVFKKVIKNSNNINIIIQIFEIIDNIQIYLKENIYNQFVTDILDDIKNLSKKITEEDIKISQKGDIKLIIQSIESLLRPIFQIYIYKEIVDKIELEIAMKCFLSKYLEKRIYGFQIIINKIIEAKGNEKIIYYEDQNYQDFINKTQKQDSYEKKHWLVPTNYLQWLEHNQIFNLVFGEYIHVELVKRSYQLLKFLYQNNKLKNDSLNSIFNYCTNKHEFLSKSIFNILSEFVIILDYNHLEYAFEKITSQEIIDIDTLNLIKSMSFNQNLQIKQSNENLLSKNYSYKEAIQEEEEKQQISNPNYTPTLSTPSDVDDQKENIIGNFQIGSINDDDEFQQLPNDQIENQEIMPNDYEQLNVADNIDKMFLNFNGEEPKKQNIQSKIPENCDIIEEEKDFPFENIRNLIKQENIEQQIIINVLEDQNKAFEAFNEQKKNFPQIFKQKNIFQTVNEQEEENYVDQSTKILQEQEMINKIRDQKGDLQIIGLRILEFLWEFIIKGNARGDKVLKDRALNIFGQLLGQQFKSAKLIYTNKALENIALNIAVNESIEIISNIINEFVSIYNVNENNQISTKIEYINYLEKECLISSLIIDSIISLKKEVLEIISMQKSHSQQQVNYPEQIVENNLNNEQIDQLEDQQEENKENSVDNQNVAINQAETIKEDDNQSTEVSSIGENYLQIPAQFELDFKITQKNRNKNDLKEQYVKEIDFRLIFLKKLYENAFHQINLAHVKILWKILIQEKIQDEEGDIFYKFLTNIMHGYQGNNFQIIDKQTSNYIFFELLSKLKIQDFSLKTFFCYEIFFMKVNIFNGFLKDNNDNNLESLKIIQPDLIGIDYVWNLLNDSEIKEVSDKAQEMLIKIIKFKTSDQDIMIKLKMSYIDNLMRNMQLCYQNYIDSKEQIFIQKIYKFVEFIYQLIQELEGWCITGKEKHILGQQINVIVDNNIDQGQKKFHMNLYQNMSIKEVREQVAEKINQKSQNIQLITRGVFLTNDKMLVKDKFQQQQTIMVMQKSQNVMEEEDILFNSNNQNPKEEVQFQEPFNLQQNIENIKMIFESMDTEFIKFILLKMDNNVDEVVIALTDENQVIDLQQQYDAKFKSNINPLPNKKQNLFEDENLSEISFILSNKIEYFEIFFEILNLNKNELNQKIWNLVSVMPVNKKIQSQVKKLPSLTSNEMINIFNSECSYKFLYILQIISSFAVCNMVQDKEQFLQRKQWKEIFIESGCFKIVYDYIMQMNLKSQLEINEEAYNYQNKLLYYLLNIIVDYIQAYVLGINISNEDIIKKIQNSILFMKSDNSYNINMEKSQVNKFQPFQNFKQENKSDSSQPTPTFQSANQSQSSRPASPNQLCQKNHEQDVQSNFSLGKSNESGKEYIMDEFKELTTKISKNQDLINLFQRSINFKEFFNKLLKILTAISFQFNDLCLINVVDISLNLLLSIIISQPNIIQQFYSYPQLNIIFPQILLQCSNEKIRKSFLKAILIICSQIGTFQNIDDEIFINTDKIQQYDSPKNFFLNSFLPFLDKIQETNYEDFFVCLSQLVINIEVNELKTLVDIKQLMQNVTQAVLSREIIEDRYSNNQDKVLAGQLLLMTSILKIRPELRKEFAHIIPMIYDFLFFVPNLEDKFQESDLHYPKCKKKNTRSRAYDLLIEFCIEQEENFLVLLPNIIKNQEIIKNLDIEINIDVKGNHGFIGLKNYGSTCYINSLLQQFYMLKSFRYGIFNSEVKEPNSNNLKQHTLFQLQLLFSNMQENIKEYIHPLDFINSIKWYDGQPINFSIQQDVNEFFNLLCDKLENDLKLTEQKDLMQVLIGGNLTHEIISLEDDLPYYGEREEPYFTISLEIKNKKNIYEALDLYVKDDILEGENKYFCDKYEKKIKVKKRCCIKSLPNNLIITLKRFEFDLNTMMKMKINDYFEFPQQLNLKKWTKQGIQDQEKKEKIFQEQEDCDDDCEDQYPNEYFEYNITGILVHSGNGESGHYYSYIKNPNDENGQWLEFNDNIIRTFNPDNIATECFGGRSENNQNFYFDWGENNKSRNAYILFYERVKPIKTKYTDLCSEGIQNDVQEKIIKQNMIYLKSKLFCDNDYLNFVKEFLCLYNYPILQTVTHHISYCLNDARQFIWMQENKFLLQLNNKILSDDQINNLILQNEEQYIPRTETIDFFMKSTAIQTIDLTHEFLHESYKKTKDIQCFENEILFLKSVFEKYIPSYFWFLNYMVDNSSIMFNIFFDLSQLEIKNSFAKLIIQSVLNVFKIEKDYLFEIEEFQKLEESNQNIIPVVNIYFVRKSCLHRFIDLFCLQFQSNCKQYIMKCSEYFQVVQFILQLSPKIVYYFISKQLLDKFIDLLQQIIQNQYTKDLGMFQCQLKQTDKIIEASLKHLVDLIVAMVKGCVTKGMQKSNSLAPTCLSNVDDNSPLMSNIEKNFTMYQRFTKIFYPLFQLTDSVRELMIHLSYENLDNSQDFMQDLINILCSFYTNYNQVDNIFSLLDSLLQLSDSIQINRIQMFFKNYNCLSRGINILSVIKNAFNKNTEQDSIYAVYCVKWMAKIGSSCSVFAQNMIKYKEDFLRILENLQQFQSKFQNQFMFQSQNINHLPTVVKNTLKQISDLINLLNKILYEDYQSNNQVLQNQKQFNLPFIEDYNANDMQFNQEIPLLHNCDSIDTTENNKQGFEDNDDINDLFDQQDKNYSYDIVFGNKNNEERMENEDDLQNDKNKNLNNKNFYEEVNNKLEIIKYKKKNQPD